MTRRHNLTYRDAQKLAKSKTIREGIKFKAVKMQAYDIDKFEYYDCWGVVAVVGSTNIIGC